MVSRQGRARDGVGQTQHPARSSDGDGAGYPRQTQAALTLPLVWTDDATRDLLDILDYIGARNFAAAERLNAAIVHAAENLPDHPYIYRSGRLAGTREAVVHPNYLLVYRVTETIEILAVLHARQRYP